MTRATFFDLERLKELVPGWSFVGGAGFATAVNSAGQVVGPFGANVLPETDAGAECWEARTNVLRNSSFVGASFGVVGSGGSLPTNLSFSSSSSQMTVTIAEVGVEDGRPFIELRLQSGSAPSTLALRFETSTGVPASAGQVWTAQNGVRLVGGSLSGVGVCYPQIETFGGAGSKNGDAVTLSSQLQTLITTHTTPASCTNLRSLLVFLMTAGASVDFTVRVYAPQLEQGSFPTPYIPTTSAAATRTAAVLSLAGLVPPTALTLFVEVDFDRSSGPANEYIAALSDGTANNRISLFRQLAAPNLQSRVVVGGAAANPTTQSDVLGAGRRKIAIAVSAGRAMTAVNGALAAAAGAPASIPAFTTLSLGCDEARSAAFLNSRIRRFSLLPYAMSDAELQALTA